MPGFRETILANSESLKDLRLIVTATQSFCTTLADHHDDLEEGIVQDLRSTEARLLARIEALEMLWTMIAQAVTERGR